MLGRLLEMSCPAADKIDQVQVFRSYHLESQSPITPLHDRHVAIEAQTTVLPNTPAGVGTPPGSFDAMVT